MMPFDVMGLFAWTLELWLAVGDLRGAFVTMLCSVAGAVMIAFAIYCLLELVKKYNCMPELVVLVCIINFIAGIFMLYMGTFGLPG